MGRNDASEVVVITGSTRGLGFGLACAFLEAGCRVVVSGRASAAVIAAVDELQGGAVGRPCDVADPDQVKALWDFAVERFGRVDIWVNNAGVAHPQADTWDLTPGQIREVVATNVLGLLYGASVALHGMRRQGFGRLYNVEGLGSDGRQVRGLAVYGSTKAAVSYLTRAMVREVRGTPLVVGSLRPGMLMTDLVTGQYHGRAQDWERDKKAFAVFGSRVEDVAPWLVERMLTDRRSGVRFTWLTPRRLLMRVLRVAFGGRDPL